ncbi:MAG: polyprenyl synthetase family protein [Trueperaceae bacterium]
MTPPAEREPDGVEPQATPGSVAKSGPTDLAERIRRRVLAALPSEDDVARGPDHDDLVGFTRLMRDYPNRSGKTLRGQFVVLSARAHGAPSDEHALTLAAALELFQNWVLVHDDVEDDSDERRGLPALHHVSGAPVAINVGDAMHVYMWSLLLSLPDRPPLARAAAWHEFRDMILRTAEGQHLDLTWVEGQRFDVGEAAYLRMVTRKTAYYTVVAPLRLGAACAGTTPDPALEFAGIDLGIAFQIRDDVLNLMPSEDRPDDGGAGYGKEFAGDLYEGKRTLVLAHLLDQADATERARIERVLLKPRAEKTRSDVDELLAAIARHGSLAYAQGVAENRARNGLSSLRGVLGSLPGRGAADELMRLFETLAQRGR